MKKKLLVVIMAMCLLAAFVIGGTLAWLTDQTSTITNTFTFGNISIDLEEEGAENNAQSFKLVPGGTITKDATVTVNVGSEACYLFVKIDETDITKDAITYAIDSTAGWQALSAENAPGVYWCNVADLTGNGAVEVTKGVFLNDTINVSSALVENDVQGNGDVELAITAYAVQSANVADQHAAWKIITPAYEVPNP